MNRDDVIELMKHMRQQGITLMETEADGSYLRLERGRPDPADPADLEAQSQAPDARARDDDRERVITAPIVGVFYAAPSPEADPYVSVGSLVQAGQTVCIIEAMKLMNDVTCQLSGRISALYVSNGDRVEYGQPLMKVERID